MTTDIRRVRLQAISWDEASNPFELMRADIDDLSIPGAQADEPVHVKEHARALVDEAENALHEGKSGKALFLIWEAATNVYMATYMAAPKIIRQRRKNERTGDKSQVRSAWQGAFHSKIDGFQKLPPAAQANYLWEKHRDACGKINRDTLGSYVREFTKSMKAKK